MKGIQVGDAVLAANPPHPASDPLRHRIYDHKIPGVVDHINGDASISVRYGKYTLEWYSKSIKLMFRLGDIAIIQASRIPTISTPVAGRITVENFYNLPHFWDHTAGLEVSISRLRAETNWMGSDINEPQFQACANVFPTKGDWPGPLVRSHPVELPLFVLDPLDPAAQANSTVSPGLDVVLAALYDAWRDRKDCSGLLVEYKKITGKDRPGFMG